MRQSGSFVSDGGAVTDKGVGEDFLEQEPTMQKSGGSELQVEEIKV